MLTDALKQTRQSAMRGGLIGFIGAIILNYEKDDVIIAVTLTALGSVINDHTYNAYSYLAQRFNLLPLINNSLQPSILGNTLAVMRQSALAALVGQSIFQLNSGADRAVAAAITGGAIPGAALPYAVNLIRGMIMA